MDLNNKYTAVMSKKTDAELTRIVTIEKHKYQQDALDAAAAEIKSRNLNEAEIAKAYQINQEISDLKNRKAEEPLEDFAKLMVILRPPSALIKSTRYDSEGYILKAKEVIKFSYYGYAFYFSMVVLIWMLGRS